MSETKNPPGKNLTIEEKLLEAWRHERRFCHLRGFSRLLIWIVALVALDFLIDWGLLARSGASAKVGMLLPLLNLVVLGWVLWHEWLRPLRRFDALRVALEIEARHAELESRLVSYTQLEATLANQPNVSRELVEAMRIEAIEQTRPLNFREIVDFGRLRNVLLVSIASLVVFSVVSFNWQEHFRTFLKRLAGVEVTYPTQTRILSLSEDLIVRLGDSVSVRAEADATGVLPEAGEIYLRPAGSDEDWKRLPLKRGSNGTTYSRTLEELTRDLEYYVRLADDSSAEFRIRVIPAPRVTAARLILTYPKYMAMADGQTDQFNLEVPENTEIRWQLTCEPAVKRLEIRHQDKSLDATLDPGGRQATFMLKASHAFKYTFHWTERGSGKDFEYDDVQHSVRVVADRVPEVELLRPTASGLATVRKTLKLMARALDDHGLSNAWLVYSIDGSEEKRLPIHKFRGVKSQEFKFSWKLASSIAELKIGMRVIFAVEVGDRHPSGAAHYRRSASRQLTIVEPDRYLEWYRGELAAQNDEIRRTLEIENTASTRVKQLKIQEGKSK